MRTLLLLLLISTSIVASEGSDIELGGAGSEPGKFLELRDIAFDAQNNLYTLDGLRLDGQTKEYVGNCRVQKFDGKGKFIAQFSVRDEKAGDKSDPQRLAVDASGKIWVTHPKINLVQQFGSDGKLLKTIEVPGALAIASWKDKIAACATRTEKINNRNALVCDQIQIIEADGALSSPIKLERQLENVQDVATDRAGNFYFQASLNQLYKFDPNGKLLRVIGAAASTRNEDGSELLHSVTVDSKGNIYTMTWGNPGRVTKFDAEFKTVTQRAGQFKWADPWSVHSGYTILAVDAEDRLWAGITHRHSPSNPNFKTYHFAPAVVRTETNFLDTSRNGVTQNTTLLLGFRPSIQIALPYSIGYELRPVAAEYNVKAANRQIHDITVKYHVHDMYKTEVAQGQFEMKLQDGLEAKQALTFTPPEVGLVHDYVRCDLRGQAAGGGRFPPWHYAKISRNDYVE